MFSLMIKAICFRGLSFGGPSFIIKLVGVASKSVCNARLHIVCIHEYCMSAVSPRFSVCRMLPLFLTLVFASCMVSFTSEELLCGITVS